MGKIAQPLRVALTGTQVSPSIDHTAFLTGRDEALRRIEAALKKVD
jgi:glutamyl-tRNA synthetase